MKRDTSGQLKLTRDFANISHIVFTDQEQQHVREDVKKLCATLEIDHTALVQRNEKEFEDETTSNGIQDVRYLHYNNRRLKLLDVLNQKITQPNVSNLEKDYLDPPIHR